MKDRSKASPYGGKGWSPRENSLKEEIGTIWNSFGVNNEWTRLKKVLLHSPGIELTGISDPDAVQMVEIPSIEVITKQHDAMAEAFRKADVSVSYVEPSAKSPPNLMFVADLLFTTPEGVILSRPASSVRAGEERFVAEALARLGIPILRSIRGNGTFEGADAAWLNPDTVMIGVGFRTNKEGAAQVSSILKEMGVEPILVDLPTGSMHLMGDLRFADRDLAICRPGRVSNTTLETLHDHGYSTHFAPDESEIAFGLSMNFVTLGPKQILTADGNPITLSFYEDLELACHLVDIREVTKAAGGIGCLTGILERK
ncbi:MAG: dimethylarginine dimethylaminohydrolase family protein [Candidatus Thorarchaeota archaeon]|jgi:N-dimethylarginine dimethylaminohydrolase